MSAPSRISTSVPISPREGRRYEAVGQGAVVDPLDIAAKPGIGGEIGVPEQILAELRPFALPLDRNQDLAAVSGREDAVR